MSNSISIRPFKESDSEPVDALLQDIWAHDPKMLMVYRIHRAWPPNSPRIQATRVATVDDTVCGVATLFESTLHPRMLWAAINVALGVVTLTVSEIVEYRLLTQLAAPSYAVVLSSATSRQVENRSSLACR